MSLVIFDFEFESLYQYDGGKLLKFFPQIDLEKF